MNLEQARPHLTRAGERPRAAAGPEELARAGSAGHVLGLPRDLAFLIGCFLLFALATVLLGRLTGAPFVLPTERVSPALGIPAIVPVAVAGIGYLLAQAARQALWPRPGQGWAGTLRLALGDLAFIGLFLAVTYLHFHIKTWMPLVNPHLFDEAYLAVDQALRPVLDALAAVRAAVARLLPAPDLWYQGAQAALVMLAFWLHALGDRRWHHHSMTALLLLLMLGPLTYLIAPAVGPFLYEDGPNAVATASQHAMHAVFEQVRTGGPAWLAAHGGEHLTAAVAAMPSLHVALATLVTYYAWKMRSALLPLILFLSGWIFVESVVSRWHYLVDLPPGVALAALVILIANRVCRWRLAEGQDG
jgi:hypothetical protein